MPSYIADGYTRDDGFIDGALPDESGERLYDALSFTYRPASRMEIVTLDANIALATRNKDIDPTCAIKAEQLACKFIADHVLAWDLKNGQADVPVSQAACERLNGYLFSHLYSLIRGMRTSDKKLGDTVQKPSDQEQAKN